MEASALGPRVLQVLDFAGARAPELQALHELAHQPELLSSADGKLETQRNQRRRRANAFKAHGMPQRLRASGNSSRRGKKQPPYAPRCRRHERRTHNLLLQHAWPTEETPGPPKGAVWLATHVWHAKRMNMKEVYGHSLAAQRTDKSVSASLTAMRNKATLHDASYVGIIELYGLPQELLAALQLVSDPAGSDFHRQRFLAGDAEGYSMLYHEGQFPRGAIAPVSFQWRPLQSDYDTSGTFSLHENWQSTKRQLWLWVHPAAYMEAAGAIASACQAVTGDDSDGIQMLDRRGQLCRFKLRGRLADEMLVGLLDGPTVGVDGDDEVKKNPDDHEGSDHEDGFSESRTTAVCQSENRRRLLRELRHVGAKNKADKADGDMYSVAVTDPRLLHWREDRPHQPQAASKASTSLLQEPATGDVPSVGTAVIASPLSGLSLSSRGKDAEEPESERILKELASLVAWTTGEPSAPVSNEPTYPFASLMSQESSQVSGETGIETEPVSLEPCSPLWSLTGRRALARRFEKDHELNDRIYQQRKVGSFASGAVRFPHESVAPLYLFAIRKQEKYTRTGGWDLIFPPASAPGLLKALVFAGALVVGLEEDAALSTVVDQPSFPCDYPDTQAGTTYWKDHARELEAEHMRKPKAKRFSFEKHGVASPFQPQWTALFNLPSMEEMDEVDEGKGDSQTPCVLRGEEYMEPFCFYRANGDDVKSPDVALPLATDPQELIPTPMPTLVRVIIAFPRRGNVAINAMLFMPSREDREHFHGDNNWNGCDLGLGKKQKNGKRSEANKRAIIGYVTSAVYDRPKAASRAIGFCACEALQQLYLADQTQQRGSKRRHHDALAMLQTPQGRMLRPVLVRVEP